MSNKPSDFPSELVTPVANIQSSLKNLNNILDGKERKGGLIFGPFARLVVKLGREKGFPSVLPPN